MLINVCTLWYSTQHVIATSVVLVTKAGYHNFGHSESSLNVITKNVHKDKRTLLEKWTKRGKRNNKN